MDKVQHRDKQARQNHPDDQAYIRNWLAFGITGMAIVGIVILGGAVIVANGDVTTRAQLVLNAVLPLFGTWVGTVLAFFFARDNFESASRSAKEFMTIQEKLQSLPVISAMTPRSQMVVVNDPEHANLVELLKQLEDKGIKRLPILSKNDYPQALVFTEGIVSYLYRFKVRNDEERKTLVIQNLCNEQPELIQPYGVVGETDTLADVQAAMLKKADCRVVFVTKSGRESDAVIGMITNTDIAEKANA
jgi:CBS domain-containing protein